MDNTAALPLNTIGELLTAVPHMLGYYPTDSLVLVSLHDNASGQARLGATMRIGLPTGLQMVVISMSELVILALVNSHGAMSGRPQGP